MTHDQVTSNAIRPRKLSAALGHGELDGCLEGAVGTLLGVTVPGDLLICFNYFSTPFCVILCHFVFFFSDFYYVT